MATTEREWTVNREEEARIQHRGVYTGTIPCRGCNKPFHTTDRRKITRCKPCQADLFRSAAILPFDAAMFDVDEKPSPNILQKLAKKLGRNVRSRDFPKLYRQDYTGVVYRSLTKKEIAAQYTDERIEQLLAKAKVNRLHGWVPDERAM